MITPEIRFRSLCRRHGIEYRKLRGQNAFVTFTPIPLFLCERHNLHSYDIGGRWLVTFEEVEDPVETYNTMLNLEKMSTCSHIENTEIEQRITEIMQVEGISEEEKNMLAMMLRRRAVRPEKTVVTVPVWYTSLKRFAEANNLVQLSQHTVNASLAQIRKDFDYDTTKHTIDYYDVCKYNICKYICSDVKKFKQSEHWWVDNQGAMVIAARRRGTTVNETASATGSLVEMIAQLLLEKDYSNGWYEALKQYAYAVHNIELDVPKYQGHCIHQYQFWLSMARTNNLSRALRDINNVGSLNTEYVKKQYGGLETFASYQDNGWTILIPWASEGGLDWSANIERPDIVSEWLKIKNENMVLVVLSQMEKIKMWCKNGVLVQ